MTVAIPSNKLWLFRPLFADGKDLSEQGIRKQYLALDPKPSALQTASPSVFAGAGAFVLGVLGFLFGKDSALLKYSGLILGVAGAGLALAGQFIFKVDLSNLTDSNETNSNKTNEPKPLPIQKNAFDAFFLSIKQK